jgi:hypothetical protein
MDHRVKPGGDDHKSIMTMRDRSGENNNLVIASVSEAIQGRLRGGWIASSLRSSQ